MEQFAGFLLVFALAGFIRYSKHRRRYYHARNRRPVFRPQRGPRTATQRVREFVLRRDHYRCVNCGSPYELEVDHIIPWSKGGKTVPANLQTLCKTCNGLKGNLFTG